MTRGARDYVFVQAYNKAHAELARRHPEEYRKLYEFARDKLLEEGGFEPMKRPGRDNVRDTIFDNMPADA